MSVGPVDPVVSHILSFSYASVVSFDTVGVLVAVVVFVGEVVFEDAVVVVVVVFLGAVVVVVFVVAVEVVVVVVVVAGFV
jgi:hypothetical protein